ncbi:MAG: hypothetical protein HQK79_23305 [Desulfobacterales bacterium]|nr:hypothetical protein [Desulfobacterales bacterium]
MLVYDIEIKKAILGKNEQPIKGIEYAADWNDYEGMGIAVICAYDYQTERTRVFCEDNFKEFQDLVNKRATIVGFNSIKFDNCLCRANGIEVYDYNSYDILHEIWRALGLGYDFDQSIHEGFGLDATFRANFPNQIGKTGTGGMAPVNWQRGKIGSVIDYCINDVRMTRLLLNKIILKGGLTNPKNCQQFLRIDPPKEYNNYNFYL